MAKEVGLLLVLFHFLGSRARIVINFGLKNEFEQTLRYSLERNVIFMSISLYLIIFEEVATRLDNLKSSIKKVT